MVKLALVINKQSDMQTSHSVVDFTYNIHFHANTLLLVSEQERVASLFALFVK